MWSIVCKRDHTIRWNDLLALRSLATWTRLIEEEKFCFFMLLFTFTTVIRLERVQTFFNDDIIAYLVEYQYHLQLIDLIDTLGEFENPYSQAKVKISLLQPKK